MKIVGRNFATRVARNAARKFGMNGALARPHQLHLLTELSTSEGQYRIPLKAEDQKRIAPGVGRGLLDRDAFFATGYALGVLAAPIIGGEPRLTATAPVYWPDPSVFNGAAAGAGNLSEAQAVESVYMGVHSLKTNEGIRIDKNPNLPFRTVQETQGGANTANMQTGLEMQEIGAVIRFGGGDENEIIVDLTCFDKTLLAGTPDHKNYLMFVLDGSIIKGATNKAYLG